MGILEAIVVILSLLPLSRWPQAEWRWKRRSKVIKMGQALQAATRGPANDGRAARLKGLRFRPSHLLYWR
jgi:hypothetical protein